MVLTRGQRFADDGGTNATRGLSQDRRDLWSLVLLNAESDRLQDNESSVTSERALLRGWILCTFSKWDFVYSECFLQKLTSSLTAAKQSRAR